MPYGDTLKVLFPLRISQTRSLFNLAANIIMLLIKASVNWLNLINNNRAHFIKSIYTTTLLQLNCNHLMMRNIEMYTSFRLTSFNPMNKCWNAIENVSLPVEFKVDVCFLYRFGLAEKMWHYVALHVKMTVKSMVNSLSWVDHSRIAADHLCWRFYFVGLRLAVQF